MQFTRSYIIFQLPEGVAHGMSVFIIWIYSVDVVTITQRYKDLQEHFGLGWNGQKTELYFCQQKLFGKVSLQIKIIKLGKLNKL